MLSHSGEVKLAGLHFTTDLLGLTQNGGRKEDDFKVSMHIQTVKKNTGSDELLYTSEVSGHFGHYINR